QRNRIGTNYNQLPVNAPTNPVNSYDKEGAMQYHHSGDAPVYAPNSYGRAYQDEEGRVENGWESDGEMVRAAYTLHSEDDDFGQAHTLVRDVFSDEERARLVDTLVGQMRQLDDIVRENFIKYWKNIEEDVAAAVVEKYNA
ncbi:MAG: catalase-related domain-containing protein, partial [Acidobacteriota bacterium]|nr:catalase-related domain-containing protein [Acidobacteriota bacterium]